MKRLIYFLLGAAAPLATYFIYRKADLSRCASSKKHRDRLQEIAVEDSFPASDPPASW